MQFNQTVTAHYIPRKTLGLYLDGRLRFITSRIRALSGEIGYFKYNILPTRRNEDVGKQLRLWANWRHVHTVYTWNVVFYYSQLNNSTSYVFEENNSRRSKKSFTVSSETYPQCCKKRVAEMESQNMCLH